MKRITRIEPKSLEIKPKLRVAAYARVSTTNEEQLNSLEAQKSHYEETILKNPEWVFAGLYYDEGITGTSKDKRLGLQDLVRDCEAHQIDLILTKSISRFARNTMDCLEIVRRLTDIGVYIIFEKEKINTETMDGEMMLSILSSLAENESLSISENQKWVVEKRFQNGTYQISTMPYGYGRVDGRMVVIPAEATIVQMIFKEAIAGKGAFTIAKKLNEMGITKREGRKWSEEPLLYILKNRHYTGDAVFGKTYSDETFKMHVNRGERNMYLVENHHEPIVSHETFERVQEIIERRGKERASKGKTNYQNRYPFSGKLICGECGKKLKRRVNQKNVDEKYTAWVCSTHIKDKDACSMLFIREEPIKQAFGVMLGKLQFAQDLMLRPLLSELRSIDKGGTYMKSEFIQDEIENKLLQLDKLSSFRSQALIDNAFYIKEKNAIDRDLHRLRQEKESLMILLSDDGREQEVKELLKIIASKELIPFFDEEIFERIIQSVEVISRQEVAFTLKCGLVLREELS